MSRGHGRLQIALLNHLRAQTEPTTFETARWGLWRATDGLTAAANANLPNTWNTSLMRAVKVLDHEKRVEIDRRRLVSFDECARHYPGKTLLGPIRLLRCALLPALQRWIEEGKAHPRYNPADNEAFHLESLPKEVRAALKGSWFVVEPQLTPLLLRLKRRNRNAVFELLAKGKAVFESEEITCRRSFAEYVQQCTDERLLPESLATEIKALTEAMLPPANAGHLRLKSFIHEFTGVPRHRRCSLKKETVEYLEHTCPDVLKHLPGYVAPPEPTHGRNRILAWQEAKHSQ